MIKLLLTLYHFSLINESNSYTSKKSHHFISPFQKRTTGPGDDANDDSLRLVINNHRIGK